MAELRKYNEATYVYFPLVEYGLTDYRTSGYVFASGDSQVSIDGGAFTNTSGLVAEAPASSGILRCQLSAAQTQGKTLVVRIVDQTGTKLWEDQAVIIETYGHASAQHVFDLGTATQDVNVVTIEGTDASDQIDTQINTRIEAYDLDHLTKNGAAPTPTAGSIMDNIMGPSFDDGNDSLEHIRNAITDLTADVGAVPGDVWEELQASHVGAGTFGEIATEIASILVDTTDMQPKFGAVNSLGTGATLFDNMQDLGGSSFNFITDSQENIYNTLDGLNTTVNNLNDISALDVWNVQTSTITMLNSIGLFLKNLNDLSASEVNAEMVDVLTVDSLSELTVGAPSATPTFEDAIMLLYMHLRNDTKMTSAGVRSIANNAGTTISSGTAADDGTTFNQGKLS